MAVFDKLRPHAAVAMSLAATVSLTLLYGNGAVHSVRRTYAVSSNVKGGSGVNHNQPASA
jgi:hypothetical protein